MHRTTINPYEELGVGKNCTDEEIKKAYRTKSLQVHPDKFTDAGEKEKANINFTRLKEARDFLLDPVKRRNYDNNAVYTFRQDLTPSVNSIINAIQSNNKDSIERAIEFAKKNEIFDINSEIGGIGTLIHLAASLGYDDAVEVLMKANAEVNVKNSEGNSPLHLAARRADDSGADVVVVLFDDKFLGEKKRPDINAQNAEGDTALHIAARNGHKRSIKELLKEEPDLGIKNKRGFTPSQVASDEKVKKKLMTMAQSFLNIIGVGIKSESIKPVKPDITSKQSTAKEKNQQQPEQTTTKQSAESPAKTQQPTVEKPSTTETMQILLLKDAEHKVLKTKEELKAILGLHIAVKSGSIERVKSWLDKGADVNSKMIGSSPLHVAAKSEKYNPAIIDLLLSHGANVNQTDSNGQTIAHLAAAYGDKALIQTLLARDEVDWNVQDKAGDTALHIALLLPDQEIAGTLIDNAKVDLSLENNDGFTISEMIDLISNENNNELSHDSYTYEAPPVEPNVARTEVESKSNSNNNNIVRPFIR